MDKRLYSNNIIRLSLLIILMMLGGSMAMAQMPEPTLTENPTFDENTEYYLYNIKAKAFLRGANEFRTRASIDPYYGYRFRIIPDNGHYRLNNFTENAQKDNNWNPQWYDMFAEANGNYENIFLDFNNNGSNTWDVTRITSTNKFTISNTQRTGTYLRWRGNWDNTRLFFDNDVDGGEWGFVSQTDYNTYMSAREQYLKENAAIDEIAFYEEAATNNDGVHGWKKAGPDQPYNHFNIKHNETDYNANNSNMHAPIMQYWCYPQDNNGHDGILPNALISRQLTGFQSGYYLVSLKVYVTNGNPNNNSLRFTANGVTQQFTPTGNVDNGSWTEFKIPITVSNDGQISLEIAINDCNYNCVLMKDLTITRKDEDTPTSPSDERVKSFEHYRGIVSEMGTPPEGLKVNYKTSEDDSRLGADVILQRAHEYTHDIYVLPGQTYTLEPFSDFHTHVTNNGYMQKYVRWYDYKTDTTSPRIFGYGAEYFDFSSLISSQIPYGFKVTNHGVTKEDGDTPSDHSGIRTDNDPESNENILYLSPRENNNATATATFGEIDGKRLSLPEGTYRVRFKYKAWETWTPNFDFTLYKENDHSILPIGAHDITTTLDNWTDYDSGNITISSAGDYVMQWDVNSPGWNAIAIKDISVTSVGVMEIGNKGHFSSTLISGEQNYGANTTYHAPNTNDDVDIFDIIAIEVSCDESELRYRKVSDHNFALIEPTLQYRQLFVIHNAKKLAEDMSATAEKNALYVNNHKIKLICPEGTPFQYRLDNYEYRGYGDSKRPTGLYYKSGEDEYSDIYHYKVETLKKNSNGTYESLGWTACNKWHSNTLATDGEFSGNINVDDVTREFKKRVYQNEGDGRTNDHVREDTEELLCERMVGELAYTYKQIEGYDRAIYIKTPSVGEYKIKIYAIETNDGYNFTDIKTNDAVEGNRVNLLLKEYDLKVLPKTDASLLTETELTQPQYVHQKQSSLEDAFGEPTAEVNFDNIKTSYCSLQNGDGYYKWPWIWETSAYGFGYSERYDYNMYVIANSNTYVPYSKPETDIRDRLFADTNGHEKGFFYYSNAASDPSRMAMLDIGKNLCTNTRVYVSAWVNEFNVNKETANIVFSFCGVKADGSETIISSYVSGYVPGGQNSLIGFRNRNSRRNQNDEGYRYFDNYEDGNNPDHRAEWMHIYFSFVPDVTNSSDFDHYIISLENNCTSSSGADYAIDDIRCFVCHPTVFAHQIKPVCNGSKTTELKFTADFDHLLDAFDIQETFTEDSENNHSFHFCFIDKEKFETELEKIKQTNPDGAYHEAFDAALVKNTYGKEEGTSPYYGTFTFNSFFESESNDGNVYNTLRTIAFDNINITDAEMKVNGKYIIAMVNAQAYPTPTYENFDITNKCAYTSEFTIIASSVIKVDGRISSDLDGASICANQKPIITLDLNGIGKSDGTVYDKSDAEFDWFAGSISEYNTAYIIKNENDTIWLNQAIVAFRAKYPSVSKDDFGTTDPTGDYTPAMKECIQHFLDAKTLKLYQENTTVSIMDQFHGLGEGENQDFYITVIPINPEPDNDNIEYCLNAFQIHLSLSTRSPELRDGDDQGKVHYPAIMRDVPLRIGLEQLRKCQMTTTGIDGNLNKTLFVPLREVHPVTKGVKKLIKDPNDVYVYLATTNDPAIKSNEHTPGTIDRDNSEDREDATGITTGYQKCIGKLQAITAQLDKDGNGSNICQIVFLKDFPFREGYSYTVKFHFLESYDDDNGNIIVEGDVCPGDVVMTIKVVPEYQMWTGEYSRNWNDDRNWRRVTRAELFNPTTEAVSNDFVTDGKVNPSDENPVNNNTNSFVPADFTKVIIPDASTVKRMPYMYNLRDNSNLVEVKYAGAPGKSYYIIEMTSNNTDIADVPETEYNSETADISCEMSSIDLTSGDVACQSWYDHTCEQIHFMSGAELMDQRYLYYKKAWADIEMEPGRWHTMASPIANVVAGDFYLPTDGARQDTPLFQDITYNTSLNDRFKPAVFQRTWNAGKATIYKLEGTDVSSENAAISLDWSHVYNDVNEQYNSGKGFAVKPDVSMLESSKRPTKVKFRFPKADKSYTYYNPGNTDDDKKTENVNSIIVGGKRPGLLIDINNDYYQTVGNVPGTTQQLQGSKAKYFLVGNPFMCYLNMNNFFTENTNLAKKYWIVTANGQRTAVSDGNEWISTIDDATVVAPGQSFFVELMEGEEYYIQPKFTSEMMSYVDNGYLYDEDDGEDPQGGNSTPGNADPANPSTDPAADPNNNTHSKTRAKNSKNHSNPVLTISASDGRNESIALLTDGKSFNHEGAEMLIDSNLDDDLFVYAAVNGQCMSIGQINEGDTIPVAVTKATRQRGNETTCNENIVMSIKGASTFGYNLYLIDSQLGTTTLLDNDITLDANTDGVRYYICSSKKDNETTGPRDYEFPRLTVSSGTITGYAPQSEPIKQLSIYSTNGMLMETFSIDAAQQKTSSILPTGTYLVKVVTPSYEHTYKLLVK